MLSAALLLTVVTQSLAEYNDGYGGVAGNVAGYGAVQGAPATQAAAAAVVAASVPGAAGAVPSPSPAPSPTPAQQQVNSFGSEQEDFTPVTLSLAPEPEEGPGPTLLPPDSTTEHKCKMVIPQECVFPFEYKGLQYTTCTGVDAMETLWCSTAASYGGKWKQCKDPCKQKWSVKAIAGAVVAGSVAATGVGLIAGAVAHSKKEGKNIFGGKEAAAAVAAPAATVAAPAAAVAAPAAPQIIILKPATPGHPGLAETVTSVQARLLEDAPATKAFRPQQSMTMGAAAADKRMVGIMVLAAAVILSVGVALYAGFSRQKRVQVQPEEKDEYSEISQ